MQDMSRTEILNGELSFYKNRMDISLNGIPNNKDNSGSPSVDGKNLWVICMKDKDNIILDF